MGFRIREIEAECKFSSSLTVEALSRAIPQAAITRALQQEAVGEARERKLTMSVVVGLRLIALDGTVEDVPDTPANAAVFGRHTTTRGSAAFPQVQAVYLAECGTHVIVDAGFWPCHTSERIGGFRMLRSVRRGMLVMWDRGFHDFDMVVATRRRGAHVLSRLPTGVQPVPLRTVSDGSVLAYLLPSEDA